METFLKELANAIALAVEVSATVIIFFGAIEAVVGALRSFFFKERHVGWRRGIWLNFAMWLLLGLEFELAADIIRTTISPTWVDLGQLAAIAGIRTVLNYFLEKDLEEYKRGRIAPEPNRVSP